MASWKVFVRRTPSAWVPRLSFGMTGYLRSFREREIESQYNRVIFYLDSGVHVAFNCRRRLGSVRYVEDPEQFIAQHNLGPDALSVISKVT
jgi:formamidopyrimidine-DNA glycosylase